MITIFFCWAWNNDYDAEFRICNRLVSSARWSPNDFFPVSFHRTLWVLIARLHAQTVFSTELFIHREAEIMNDDAPHKDGKWYEKNLGVFLAPRGRPIFRIGRESREEDLRNGQSSDRGQNIWNSGFRVFSRLPVKSGKKIRSRKIKNLIIQSETTKCAQLIRPIV